MSFAWKGFHSFPPSFSPAVSLGKIVSQHDFTRTASLPAWLSLSRADASPIATFRNSSGVLTTVSSAGDARFDHDYAGTPLGLLLEPKRTNLQTQSSLTSWTASRSSISANALVAPTGTSIMSKITSDGTASNTHSVNRTSLLAIGTRYTFSAYFQQSGPYSWVAAQLSNTPFGTTQRASFNLSGSGAVGTIVGGGAASIERAANSNYRGILSPAVASGSAGLYGTFILLQQADETPIFNGDNATAAGAWGVQVEDGPYATSLIVTGALAVTREADVLTMTGYASNLIRTEEESLATGLVTYGRYAGSSAFNTAMSGPGIRLRKVWIYG